MFKVPELNDLEVAFGEVAWLPQMADIPKDLDPKWEKIVAKWFYFGLPPDTKFQPAEGVDAKKAMRALKACLGSFSQKHEHKMATAAYLLSQWFTDIQGWEAQTAKEKEFHDATRHIRP